MLARDVSILSKLTISFKYEATSPPDIANRKGESNWFAMFKEEKFNNFFTFSGTFCPKLRKGVLAVCSPVYIAYKLLFAFSLKIL